MTARDNYLKAVRFETPEYIPMQFYINESCWNNYPQEFLLEQIEKHPFLFPEAEVKKIKLPYTPEYRNVAQKDHPYVDDFGCLWETSEDGITGTVVKHPLDDWDKLSSYKAPDPEKVMGIGAINWEEEKKNIEKERSEGKLIRRGLRHGHTFLQLCDIRGYEDLLCDMVDEEPELFQLIEIIENFNMQLIKKYVDLKVDVMEYAEDLGMQVGPMISPEYFRKYIKPSYQRLMKPARDNGIIVHMHSDGDIRLLVDDLIEGGVGVINLQDQVNGVDWIAERFAGKVCIDLDIDRQFITAKGTPADIDELIKTEVSKIGRKEGGLSMVYGLYGGIPLENVVAVMDAMEKYAFYYEK